MSVLINSTFISLKNSTNHLIEISCEADQDELFHVKSVGDVIYEKEKSDNIVSALFEYVYGSKLQKVTLNLKPKKESVLTINSKSELQFNFTAKVKNSTDSLPGFLPISTEYQGTKIFVNLVEEQGIMKDEKGNVVIIGKSKPVNHEIIIKVEIKDGSNEKIFIDEYHPAFCQINVSNDL